jgi:RNA polymerase sigma-70 factor (ECF subfamily)
VTKEAERPWSSLNEDELVVRYRADPSQRSAFRELYQRYSSATFAFFYRRVRDADWAADLNQELYLRLVRSISGFRGDCSWKTWVFTVARNTLASSRFQRWSRMAERTVTLDETSLRDGLSFPPEADGELEMSRFRTRLKRCLARLDEVSRVVILGHYFEGITLRELTERLGLRNPSGSRAVLIGALRLLRRCMLGEERR